MGRISGFLANEKAIIAYGDGDYSTAARYFRKAAENGHASAQYNLAVLYSKGQGVPQSDVEATKWNRLAAEQGDVTAQYNLGIIYEEGQGVPQDKIEAEKWYRLAANQGDQDARYRLDGMLKREGDAPQANIHSGKDYAYSIIDASGKTELNSVDELASYYESNNVRYFKECYGLMYREEDTNRTGLVGVSAITSSPVVMPGKLLKQSQNINVKSKYEYKCFMLLNEGEEVVAIMELFGEDIPLGHIFLDLKQWWFRPFGSPAIIS